jgi:hypothetical protein
VISPGTVLPFTTRAHEEPSHNRVLANILHGLGVVLEGVLVLLELDRASQLVPIRHLAWPERSV